jgi:hypothetical protein
MARYQNSASSASSTPITASLTSNDTIQLGDVVSLGSDGNLYAVNDPTVPGLSAVQKPAYLSSSLSVQAIPGASAALGAGNVQPVLLTNGSCATLNMNTASGAPYTVQVDIVSQSGAITGPITIATTANMTLGCLVALAGGGFAVVYASATNHPMFAIYSNTGALVVGPTAVDANNAYSVIQAIALTGGGFAVFYMTSGGPFFAVISAAGSVGTPANFETNIASANQMSCAALTGGGFVLVAYDAYTWAKTYTAAGALVASNTTAMSTLLSNYCWATSNGGFAVAGITSNSQLLLLFFNSACVLQTQNAVQPVMGGYYYGGLAGATLTNGNFVFAWVLLGSNTSYVTSTINVGVYTPTGTASGGASFGAGTANSETAIVGTTDGGALIHYSVGTTAYAAKLTAAGALSGTAVATASAAGSGANNSVQFVSFGSSVVGRILNGNYVSFYTAYNVSRVPVGVAMNAASVGQSAAVQISGSATTRLTFSQSWNCSYQGNSPPGQMMSVIGNLAVMQGLQLPAQKTQIN